MTNLSGFERLRARLDRRQFMAATAFGLLVAPVVSETQPTTKVWRIGLLSPAAGHNSIDEVFERSMMTLGYIEGKNVQFERRYTGGHLDQFSQAAADFVRLNVDLIVTWGSHATAAAKNATSTIPIVFVAAGTGVSSNVIGCLARLLSRSYAGEIL